MPFDPDKASNYDKDADTPSKKHKWAKIANNVRTRAMRQGASEGAASTKGIKVANKVVS